MMQAKNPTWKLGQVDLINISVVDYQFRWTQTVLQSKGRVFPDPFCKSVHLSTDEPGLHGIENKGYPIRVHILAVHAGAPLTLDLVIGH